jgi:hypothetical protein
MFHKHMEFTKSVVLPRGFLNKQQENIKLSILQIIFHFSSFIINIW